MAIVNYMNKKAILIWVLLLSLAMGPVLATRDMGGMTAGGVTTAEHHAQTDADRSGSEHCVHRHMDDNCAGPACTSSHCFSSDFRAEAVTAPAVQEIAAAVTDFSGIPVNSRAVLPPERPPRR